MTHTVHLQLEDIDNTVLQRLCGALDSNLEALGKALDIQISRRFEHFTFMGELAHAGRRALLALAEAAEQGDLDDNAIRLAAVEAKTADEKHEEKHHDQQYYFRTKRGERIVLVRPAVEAGEKLGFLPGDLAQKVDPYLRPLYDALYDLMGFDRVTKLMEKGLIEIAPLAYMRGRTLNGAYVILDEAQNTTPEQMKMFLTRIGFGAKAVITGDISQIDLPRNVKSGLKDAREKLRDVEGLYFHTFTSEDVVRHPLVQKIVEAYEAAEEAEDKISGRIGIKF